MGGGGNGKPFYVIINLIICIMLFKILDAFEDDEECKNLDFARKLENVTELMEEAWQCDSNHEGRWLLCGVDNR